MLEEFIAHYAVWRRDPDEGAQRFLTVRFTALDQDSAKAEAKRMVRAATVFHLPEELQDICGDPEKDIEITVIPWAHYGTRLDNSYDALVRGMRHLEGQGPDEDDEP